LEKMEIAVLKEIDARDLSPDLRAALKKTFGQLKLSAAGMKRLEILDRDEENFVNEMLFAGIMPSTSSDKALLGNELITNLAGNTISGNFTPAQLTTMAMNIAKALGIKNSTTGRLLQEAVDSKLVQAAVGVENMPEVFDRVREIREGLESPSTSLSPRSVPQDPSPSDLAKIKGGAKLRESVEDVRPQANAPKIHAMKNAKKSEDSDSTKIKFLPNSSPVRADSSPVSGIIPKASPETKVATARPMSVSVPENTKVNRDVLKLLGGDYAANTSIAGAGAGGSKSAKAPSVDPRKLEEESIREGASLQGCDLKSTTSDKICQSCGDESKACICHTKMIDDYFGKASGGKPLEAVLREKIEASSALVQSNEELEQDEDLTAIDVQLATLKPDSDAAKKLRADKEAVSLEMIRNKVKKKFFYKKALLNGLMNTKTPACLMANDAMFGRIPPDPRDTTPVYAVGNEKFCYQFDVNPEDGFEKLSRQDQVMLGLFKGTMDELTALRKSTLALTKDGTNRYGFESNVYANEKNEGPPPLTSGRNEVNWIFVRESSKVTGTTKNTENMLRRRLRDCSGPREWGGVLLKNLEYLQPMAEACLDPIAYEMEIKKKYRSTIEALCNLKGRTEYGTILNLVPPISNGPSAELVKQKNEEMQALNLQAESYFKRRAQLKLGGETQKTLNIEKFCREVTKEYRLVFDVLKATVFHNEAEICAEKNIKEYNGKYKPHNDFE
jgi:hypothetical protein